MVLSLIALTWFIKILGLWFHIFCHRQYQYANLIQYTILIITAIWCFLGKSYNPPASVDTVNRGYLKHEAVSPQTGLETNLSDQKFSHWLVHKTSVLTSNVLLIKPWYINNNMLKDLLHYRSPNVIHR